jgi:hypothetical protein
MTLWTMMLCSPLRCYQYFEGIFYVTCCSDRKNADIHLFVFYLNFTYLMVLVTKKRVLVRMIGFINTLVTHTAS